MTGKTYEIVCRRGYDRVNCKFKAQDRELNCSICSFAGFRERQKITNKDNESKQPDIQQQDRPTD